MRSGIKECRQSHEDKTLMRFRCKLKSTPRSSRRIAPLGIWEKMRILLWLHDQSRDLGSQASRLRIQRWKTDIEYSHACFEEVSSELMYSRAYVGRAALATSYLEVPFLLKAVCSDVISSSESGNCQQPWST